MSGVTFANPITSRDVSLAIEKFIIAPLPNPVWAPAKIDIDLLPPGFRDLGPVDEESPNVTISRNQFQLRTGIPQVIQFQAVTSMDARVTFNIQTRDTRAMIAALAAVPNNAAKYVFSGLAGDTPAYGVSTIALTPAPTNTSFTLVAGPTNGQVWKEGDMILHAATAVGVATSQNWAIVESVSGLAVTLKSPGFVTIPLVSEFVVKPLADFIPFGTAALPQSTLMGVADFVDGYQLVHKFDKVQGSAEVTENIRASENNRIPFAFNVFGLPSAVWGNELVLGERYLFQS